MNIETALRLHPIEMLEQLARSFIAAGLPEKGAVGGHNGPHHDPETPMRNSAHWLIMLSRLWQLTGVPAYRQAAEQLVDVVMADDALRQGHVPTMRMAPPKDAANGVIGAAWLIEGLVIAGRALERADALDAARKLGSWFPFDQSRKLWIVREPDGSTPGIDTTLNHQIWFAMAAAMVPDPGEELDGQLQAFFTALPRHLHATSDGLLVHTVHSPPFSKAGVIGAVLPLFAARGPAARLGLPKRGAFGKMYRIQEMHTAKETGYLVFTLHALARISRSRFGQLLDGTLLDNAFHRLSDADFRRVFDANKWSFPYNPPGFEYPLLAEILGTEADLSSTGRSLYAEQIRRTFDPDREDFSRGNEDPATMTARAYALALCNVETLDRIAVEAVA